MSAVGRWIERRRSLKEEYQRILLVDSEANELVEELRRRRDRLTPRRLSFPYLREALHEVEERADSREDICPECQAGVHVACLDDGSSVWTDRCKCDCADSQPEEPTT